MAHRRDTLRIVLAILVHTNDEQDQDGGLLVLYRVWEKMKGIKVAFGVIAAVACRIGAN